MPTREELPDALGAITHRHALEISDTRWDYDIGRLGLALEKIAQRHAEERAGDTVKTEPDAAVEPSRPSDSPSPSSAGLFTRLTQTPRRRLLALAGAAVAVLIIVAVLALGGGGGTPERTLSAAGLPFTFSYPANFKTHGLKLGFQQSAYAGLGPDDYVAATNTATAEPIGVFLNNYKRDNIPVEESHETRSKLHMTVVSFTSTDTATHAAYIARLYFFKVFGQEWILNCAWTVAHSSQVQAACNRALDSIALG
jgi:hypothetical protein